MTIKILGCKLNITNQNKNVSTPQNQIAFGTAPKTVKINNQVTKALETGNITLDGAMNLLKKVKTLLDKDPKVVEYNKKQQIRKIVKRAFKQWDTNNIEEQKRAMKTIWLIREKDPKSMQKFWEMLETAKENMNKGDRKLADGLIEVTALNSNKNKLNPTNVFQRVGYILTELGTEKDLPELETYLYKNHGTSKFFLDIPELKKLPRNSKRYTNWQNMHSHYDYISNFAESATVKIKKRCGIPA